MTTTAHAVAAAIVTAIRIAVWYSLVRAVVVYPDYRYSDRYWRIQPGERVYILSRSADGYWCRVRTADGREGWVRASHLSGNVREYR